MVASAIAAESRSIPLESIESVVESCRVMGEGIYKSGMFGCLNSAQGFVIAFQCIQTGMPLLSFQQRFHLVDGKPSKKADVMLAELREAGGSYRWIDDGTDGLKATIEVEYEGNKQTVTYTIDNARQARLVKPDSNWVKNPANMLRARVSSTAVRMVCPEVVAGLYTPEEIEDFDQATTATSEAPTSNWSDVEEPTKKRGRPKKSDSDTATPSGVANASQSTESASQAPAAMTESPATTAPAQQAATPEVIQAPAKEAEKPKETTVVETTATTKPAATEPANTTQTPTSGEAPANGLATESQLVEVEKLWTTLGFNRPEREEAWQGLLTKLGCPVDATSGKRKARLATEKQVAYLLDWMGQQVQKLGNAQTRKTAESWAEGKLGSSPATQVS